jgi:hypothetical protein
MTPFVVVTRPVRIALHAVTRTYHPGEVLALDDDRTTIILGSPLVRDGVVRLMTPGEVEAHNARAREGLDTFFTAGVMPGLARLHAQGRLPDFAEDLDWRRIEEEWAKASEGSPEPCDAGKVKRRMRDFIEARGGRVDPVPEAPASEVRAITIRHARTGQTVVVLSTVAHSWLRAGWAVVEPKTAHDVARGEAAPGRDGLGHGPKKEEKT